MAADRIQRLSLEKCHDLVRAGALTEEDPVEFLDGWLVHKTPKNRQHGLATNHTRHAIERLVPAGWHVETQEPITTENSEPEPDLLVIRGEVDDYPDRHPGPEDIAMLVEVADTTLGRDRGLKKRLYAQSAIPMYWIVNLFDRRVEAYADPSGPAATPDYARREDYDSSQTIPLIIDGQQIAEIPVEDLLP